MKFIFQTAHKKHFLRRPQKGFTYLIFFPQQDTPADHS